MVLSATMLRSTLAAALVLVIAAPAAVRAAASLPRPDARLHVRMLEAARRFSPHFALAPDEPVRPTMPYPFAFDGVDEDDDGVLDLADPDEIDPFAGLSQKDVAARLAGRILPPPCRVGYRRIEHGRIVEHQFWTYYPYDVGREGHVHDAETVSIFVAGDSVRAAVGSVHGPATPNQILVTALPPHVAVRVERGKHALRPVEGPIVADGVPVLRAASDGSARTYALFVVEDLAYLFEELLAKGAPADSVDAFLGEHRACLALPEGAVTRPAVAVRELEQRRRGERDPRRDLWTHDTWRHPENVWEPWLHAPVALDVGVLAMSQKPHAGRAAIVLANGASPLGSSRIELFGELDLGEGRLGDFGVVVSGGKGAAREVVVGGWMNQVGPDTRAGVLLGWSPFVWDRASFEEWSVFGAHPFRHVGHGRVALRAELRLDPSDPGDSRALLGIVLGIPFYGRPNVEAIISRP
jgi:hypothetical protein